MTTLLYYCFIAPRLEKPISKSNFITISIQFDLLSCFKVLQSSNFHFSRFSVRFSPLTSVQPVINVGLRSRFDAQTITPPLSQGSQPGVGLFQTPPIASQTTLFSQNSGLNFSFNKFDLNTPVRSATGVFGGGGADQPAGFGSPNPGLLTSPATSNLSVEAQLEYVALTPLSPFFMPFSRPHALFQRPYG
jgi:hypothetical protein